MYRCKEPTPAGIEEAEPFFDLNKEFPKGTTAFRCTSWSEDGSHFAYGLSHAGSDWVTIKVRTADGEDLPDDVLEHAKFTGIEWRKDGSGFFYSRYPSSDKIKGAEARLSKAEEGDATPAASSEDEDSSALEQGTETDANVHQMLCYHTLGTAQSEDLVVFRTPEQPLWRFSAVVTDGDDTLLVSMDDGCDPVNRLFYADLKE